MQDEQFLVPMANLILCFQLNFAIFCGYIWAKNRLYTFEICSLNAVITLSNNKQNKYSNSIYKIYLKPCHDHCFSLTYFQNNIKIHNDLARRFFYFTKISVLLISEYFSISVFPKFGINLPITSAVCNFA